MPKTLNAAIYVRISSDPSGARLGVTRQLDDCRTKAAALGWTVSAVYEDNDVSASTGKRRPAYERMLADLAAGTVNGVVVWDLDRLTRRPIEVEHFIDLADRHGISLASVGGDVDLSTDNGRMFARIKGAVARAEVERKSTRQKSANAQKAMSGRPHGGRRAFGYSAEGMQVDEVEAAEVRKAVDSLLAGASVHSIKRDLNGRGVTTTAGGAWGNTEVRRMLGNPRYAALRDYQGQSITGTWPAIIQVDAHRSVLGVLSDPRRRKAGPPRRHLLSGVARCGVCDGRIFGVSEKKRNTVLYRCESRRHVSRRAGPVDDLVTAVIIARLSQPDALEVFTRQRDDRTESTGLREQETTLRRRLDTLAEDYAAGHIDRPQLRAGSERLRADLETISATLDAMVRSPILTDLVSTGDLEATWRALDIERQRAVVNLLLTVHLAPPGTGVRTFDPQTVLIAWRTPS